VSRMRRQLRQKAWTKRRPDVKHLDSQAKVESQYEFRISCWLWCWPGYVWPSASSFTPPFSPSHVLPIQRPTVRLQDPRSAMNPVEGGQSFPLAKTSSSNEIFCWQKVVVFRCRCLHPYLLRLPTDTCPRYEELYEEFPARLRRSDRSVCRSNDAFVMLKWGQSVGAKNVLPAPRWQRPTSPARWGMLGGEVRTWCFGLRSWRISDWWLIEHDRESPPLKLAPRQRPPIPSKVSDATRCCLPEGRGAPNGRLRAPASNLPAEAKTDLSTPSVGSPHLPMSDHSI